MATVAAVAASLGLLVGTGEGERARAAAAPALAAVRGWVAPPPSAAAVARADLVLLGGKVYTQDAARPWAQAVAVRAGRLTAVGTDREVRRLVGPRTRIVDLAGMAVLPAFHDAHVHPVAAGVELGQCNLVGAESEREVARRVKAYAASHRSARWIVGSGWALTLFADANPHKRILDAAVPDRPVALYSADGHSIWLNSVALRLARIGRATADPPAGRIERDPKTGEPTGTLREAAIELAAHVMPAPTRRELEHGLARAQDILASHGIVSVTEASAGPDYLETYAAAARSGRLKLRVRAALSWEEAAAEAGGAGKTAAGSASAMDASSAENAGTTADASDGAVVAVLDRWRERYRSPGFRPEAVKLFVDGVVEARTAALLEPYLVGGVPATGSDALGKPTFPAARLSEVVGAVHRAGFQVHMHAIGDGAVRMGLDALAAARASGGRRDARPVLAHLEMIDRADVRRFAELGAVAAIQPLWAYPDEYIENLTVPLIGPERTSRVYPFGTLARAGTLMAGGSDWSVSSPSPLEAIQVAVTRQDPESEATAALGPAAERLSLREAVSAYTRGGAAAAFEDADSGTLAPGRWADLVVLDRNPFDVPLRRIGRIRVMRTFNQGREIYRSPGQKP